MNAASSPARSQSFRLMTIGASGAGSFILALWAMQSGFGGQIGGLPSELVGAVISALCALAASLAAMSFFAGVDESEEYVYQETQIDKLTGLKTRTAIVGLIATAAARSLHDGRAVFLLDIDIDRMKHINDTIGFGQGDQLIRCFAKRLVENLPPNTQVGRIGAGEFAVLLSDEAVPPRFDAFLDSLMERLMEPYQLPSHLQSVSVSMGLVAMPLDGNDPIRLLRHSNLALQSARANGIGSWSVYSDEMGKVAEYHHWIESELHIAFERGDFDVHYQPQMNLSKGDTVGYEALIRWKHPQRGMIPPTEFIPVAEETGMISLIGEWVLRRACTDAKHLPADCFVAVNISPIQFGSRDFVQRVRKIIDETGIDPARLELEVTETAMMQDRERAAAILCELGEMGISVAVDDFGTGYSNLSYLIDFRFKKLKIDRSFVARMENDDNSGAVVSTIVGLSRALGVRTIAEGVETEGQATLLRAAGCDVVQGFLFGRPEPLDFAVPRRHENAQPHAGPSLAMEPEPRPRSAAVN
ncbi:EAL domain-containing protein [Chelativorans sp. ZYF759]|uniref:putative bifunctional diguanylate cyclase/phosphodiesterase n=1 Tax=Chelativorans sp. ZYF759 TaxID=2692213 RepID=UPI00145D00D3|nr:bifunctional diguanylate cyclase/phosphodiesterase [Chelativorans sp. ZYF759]NMG40544.1 EAL domain-containing protein [Chelativorans sp. ZYF759]